MKKALIILLAVVALVASPAFAQLGPSSDTSWSPQKTLISAVGSTTTGYYPTAGVNIPGATSVLFQIVSASTSNSTISFEQSLGGTFWTTSATVTNPTSVGELWQCPATPYVRANLSAHASGTISAFVSWRKMQGDPVGAECKKLTQSVNSFGALSVTNLTNSALTSGRVPYSGSGGIQQDAAPFTYSGGTLTSTIFAGGLQPTIAAKSSNGAIASAPGIIAITKGSALGASTLATPTITTHDGYVLTIVSTTAFAHVVSVAAGIINGGANTTITFTSAAVGDSVTLVAYQGVWYMVASRGTITIS